MGQLPMTLDGKEYIIDIIPPRASDSIIIAEVDNERIARLLAFAPKMLDRLRQHLSACEVCYGATPCNVCRETWELIAMVEDA